MEPPATSTSQVISIFAKNKYTQHIVHKMIFMPYLSGTYMADICMKMPHIKWLASTMCPGDLYTCFVHCILCWLQYITKRICLSHIKCSSHCSHSVLAYIFNISGYIYQNTKELQHLPHLLACMYQKQIAYVCPICIGHISSQWNQPCYLEFCTHALKINFHVIAIYYWKHIWLWHYKYSSHCPHYLLAYRLKTCTCTYQNKTSYQHILHSIGTYVLNYGYEIAHMCHICKIFDVHTWEIHIIMCATYEVTGIIHLTERLYTLQQQWQWCWQHWWHLLII